MDNIKQQFIDICFKAHLHENLCYMAPSGSVCQPAEEVLPTYHHNPDKKESVTNENEENGNLTDKEVNSICLKERTILDNIFATAWVIKYNTQNNPYHHVDYWAS
jgi:hypothetical protein